MWAASSGRFRSLLAGCVVIGVVAGCSVSEKKLEEAESKIEALRQKGVADSLLSGPSVLVFQARTAIKLGDGLKARKSADSAFKLITAAESQLSSASQNLKPAVDSIRASLVNGKGGLTGMHLLAADSMIKIIDSLMALNWVQQAHIKGIEAGTILTALLQEEKTAAGIRPKLVGTWNRTEKSDFGGRLMSRYTFKKDGKLELSEESKGQSGPDLKEDWKFLSWGSYDLKGDTIFLFINRERCVEQTFWNLVPAGGRQEWKKSAQPTYDSTIANGAKDRFIQFEYLTQNFRK